MSALEYAALTIFVIGLAALLGLNLAAAVIFTLLDRLHDKIFA